MTRKDPAAVSLGRKGGKVTSPAKAEAARRNAERRLTDGYRRGYQSGWSAGVQRAAEMVRLSAVAYRVSVSNGFSEPPDFDRIAARIEAEPAPKKGQP